MMMARVWRLDGSLPDWVSPSTIWVQGSKLKLLGLAACDLSYLAG